MEKPKEIQNPNMNDIREIALDMLNNGTEDNDNKQYLYEAVMKAYFGNNVFNYLNNL